MTATALPPLPPKTTDDRQRRVRSKLYAMKMARDEALREVWRCQRQCAGDSPEYECYGRLLLQLRQWGSLAP